MTTTRAEGEVFENLDFTQESSVLFRDYDDCTFDGCKFSSVDLSKVTFAECVFRDCDLSMVRLQDVSFQEVNFEDCKLVGTDFSLINPFLLDFKFVRCQLDFGSFHALKMERTKFIECKLHEVDFSEANLANAHFSDCNMEFAIFENSILEGADFSSSYNYRIDPESNYLQGACFDLEGLPGLLVRHRLRINS